MLRTLAMWVAYDGTDFHGWQTQAGVRTVQETLEQAIRRAVRHQLDLAGSGRTDQGVHAAEHVSSFKTTNTLDVEKLRHSIGARLPKDLSIIKIRDVRSDFHATRSAVSKLYRYRIHNVPGRPVENLTQRYVYHFWHPLDFDRMRAAAEFFIGPHDFTALASKGTPRQSMVRTIIRCAIERHRDEVVIDVEGDGFLYKQVRNMVGTLIEVGRGHWEPEYVRNLIAGKDRSKAGPTVPARGLCLMWVRYPPELLVPVPASGTDAIAAEPSEGSTPPESALSPPTPNHGTKNVFDVQ